MLQRIIIPGGHGRTCNQLFQITRWIPAAIEHGIPLYFPGFRPYARSFCGTQGEGMPRFPRGAPPLDHGTATLAWLLSGVNRLNPRLLTSCLRVAARLPGNVVFDLDDSGRDGPMTTTAVLEKDGIAGGRTLWIKGWLYQDQDGARKHADIVRDFFAAPPLMAQRTSTFMQSARRDADVLIGVHLRRGDYRTWRDGQCSFDDATYCGVMRQLARLFPNRRVRFLLVSDEALQLAHFYSLDIVAGFGEAVGDLYSLAACDYLVGPPSTFSAWAAWYGDVPISYIEDPSTPLRLELFTSAR